MAVGINHDRSERDARGGDPVVDGGDGGRLPGRRGDRFGREFARPGESPGSTHQGTDTDAVRIAAADPRDLLLPAADRFGPVAADMGIGIHGARPLGFVDGQQDELQFPPIQPRASLETGTAQTEGAGRDRRPRELDELAPIDLVSGGLGRTWHNLMIRG